MNSKDFILSRVRSALVGSENSEAASSPRPAYRCAGAMSPAIRSARFLERLADYNVHITSLRQESEIADACGARLAANGSARYAAPHDLPSAWRPLGVEVQEDRPNAPLSHDVVDRAPSAITGCAIAIAETGTVILDGGPSQGRRALTLLVDHHICIVFADQLVELVPEALQAMKPSAVQGRPLTFFSGPSATADIEFERVVGVHGPRRLDVLFVENRNRTAQAQTPGSEEDENPQGLAPRVVR